MRMRTVLGEVVVGSADAREVCFSPLVVEKVLYARSKCGSSADAAHMLRVLADIQVSPEEVDLITTQAATGGRATK